jgi:hypothetical protein
MGTSSGMKPICDHVKNRLPLSVILGGFIILLLIQTLQIFGVDSQKS